MHRSQLFVTSLVFVMWTNFGTAVLAVQDNEGPPVDQPIDITLPPGAACVFGVSIVGQGKMKTIELPSDRTVITSAGLHVTVKNLDDPIQAVAES
jgi:hypothetical protein